MKISDAIVQLQQIQAELGDLELVTVTDIDGTFMIEEGKIIDVIEIPDDDETTMYPVCAIMEPLDEDGLPTLRAVKDD